MFDSAIHDEVINGRRVTESQSGLRQRAHDACTGLPGTNDAVILPQTADPDAELDHIGFSTGWFRKV